MDLVASMLFDSLSHELAEKIEPTIIRPRLARRLSRLPVKELGRALFNIDRFLNRFIDYPAALRQVRDQFDLFHIMDHSYSHLVHSLPAERTIVTCHDLDTFRCILHPEYEPRSWAFRIMTRRILEGFKHAARVSCDTNSTREAVLRHELASPEHALTIHLGVNPLFSPQPDPEGDREAAVLIGAPRDGEIDLLHVGSTIARKSIDVLLRVFAALRETLPKARLIRVGGRLTPEQADLAAQLGLTDSLVTTPFVTARTLAAIYRRSAILLMPSAAEGFGLPVAEAMACGIPILVSNIEALREVAGDAGEYAPQGETEAWTEAALSLLRERSDRPARWLMRRTAVLERARKFSWSEAAARTGELYCELLS